MCAGHPKRGSASLSTHKALERLCFRQEPIKRSDVLRLATLTDQRMAREEESRHGSPEPAHVRSGHHSLFTASASPRLLRQGAHEAERKSNVPSGTNAISSQTPEKPESQPTHAAGSAGTTALTGLLVSTLAVIQRIADPLLRLGLGLVLLWIGLDHFHDPS